MDVSDSKSLEEYFRVNVEKKLLIKVPDEEDHNLTPATRLLEKRREMLEVENGLNSQKEEFQKRMESLSQKRLELAKKEETLKGSLVKFDKFLKENDSKRSRALKKSNEERKMRESKEAEIQRLRETLAGLTAKKDRQDRALESHLAYQRYLELVIEAVEDFGEVKDIIARYDTLIATNSELVERSREAQERSEQQRASLGARTEEKNNVILAYNNEMADLQTDLEEIQQKSAKWQAEWDLTVKNATQKSLLLGQIKMATNNLFNIVKSHLNNRLNNTTDTPLQLEKIQQFMLDLSEITSELRTSSTSTFAPPVNTATAAAVNVPTSSISESSATIADVSSTSMAAISQLSGAGAVPSMAAV